MAITQTICDTFQRDLLLRFHDMEADVLKMALYSSSATLNANTTEYTTSGEVVGTNYTAGGATLTNVGVTLSGGVVYLDFDDVTWANVTLTARGALVYNSTRSNRSIFVLDFGSDKTKVASNFIVQLPAPSTTTAILRITKGTT